MMLQMDRQEAKQHFPEINLLDKISTTTNVIESKKKMTENNFINQGNMYFDLNHAMFAQDQARRRANIIENYDMQKHKVS